MTIPAALVLFAVIWFMTLFVVLPLRLTSQGEAGEIVKGTPASAPEGLRLGRKLLWVTLIAVVIFVPVALVIASGAISMRDIDFFGRMGPG